MKCKYKELLNKDGECDLTYPDCTKKVICYYEEKYHDLLIEAQISQAELEESGDVE